jgi:hypothetical protein
MPDWSPMTSSGSAMLTTAMLTTAMLSTTMLTTAILTTTMLAAAMLNTAMPTTAMLTTGMPDYLAFSQSGTGLRQTVLEPIKHRNKTMLRYWIEMTDASIILTNADAHLCIIYKFTYFNFNFSYVWDL